ncbi:MAG: 4a-hydroxytetrahydrobiopterin dehydratase [Rudaea sp.]
MNIEQLRAQHCMPLKGKQHQVSGARAHELVGQLPGWKLGLADAHIQKQFRFADFVHALAFANALGWIAECENHHPDLELGWGHCLVRFSTHDVGGLSMNDFICAAKVEVLSAN